MTQEKSELRQESPADRLGILYVTSFLLIAILSAFAQYFILRELAFQSNMATSIIDLVSHGSLDRPLSLAALAALAEQDPAKRGSLLDAVRKALEERRALNDQLNLRLEHGSNSDLRIAQAKQAIARADRHQERAIASANGLLERLARNETTSARTSDLVREIVAEETAAASAVTDAVRQDEARAIESFSNLRGFELQVFCLIVLVLTLEGLFVVNPAIAKIRIFMKEMQRTNHELRNYTRKLERSNSELQDFASVASHDLQEPLRKVQAFSDRLRSRCAPLLDPQGQDYLDRIQNAASRMQNLINDLLTYARVSTKAQPFVPTDLVSVTNEVVSDLEARIEQVQGTVQVGDLPKVDADPLQVRQLMQNLIGNALKYKRPDVPPVVKISGTHSIDDGSLAAPGRASEFCQIRIEDNGIGFEQIYAEKIFTIFQRLHGRSEYEGTGVGLAVCRKIVERHGGSISANSTPGLGSVFTVTLPIRQPTENPADVFTA